MKVLISVQGGSELRAAFRQVEEGLLDLRKLGVWDIVGAEFRKIEKEIFDSEGAAGAGGRWQKLSVPYAIVKERRWGPMPILQASGRLYRSLTKKGAPDSVFEPGAQELTIGTKVPYAGYHRGGPVMPRRLPVDLTQEHKDRISDRIRHKIRQLAANARLAELRGTQT